MSHTVKRSVTRIGPRDAGRLMTAREFDEYPDSRWVKGYRYELINGVLIVTPPPGNAEIAPNEYLGYLLLTHQECDPDGRALDASLPEQTLPTTPNRRRCDRAIWVGLGRTPNPESDVPAIVVEFVSSSRRDQVRDYETKRDEYRRLGVKEYWIIDRFRRALTVWTIALAEVETRRVPEGETYSSPLLPGFVLPVGRILARADHWAKRRRTNKPPMPPGSG